MQACSFTCVCVRAHACIYVCVCARARDRVCVGASARECINFSVCHPCPLAAPPPPPAGPLQIRSQARAPAPAHAHIRTAPPHPGRRGPPSRGSGKVAGRRPGPPDPAGGASPRLVRRRAPVARAGRGEPRERILRAPTVIRPGPKGDTRDERPARRRRRRSARVAGGLAGEPRGGRTGQDADALVNAQLEQSVVDPKYAHLGGRRAGDSE